MIPQFPTYNKARVFIDLIRGTRDSQLQGLINILNELSGTPQSQLDWKDPDTWISDRIEDSDLRSLAWKIWNQSDNLINPRYIQGLRYFMINHKLVQNTVAGFKLTMDGSDFLESNHGEIERRIDLSEGNAIILYLVQNHSLPNLRKSDLFEEWQRYLKLTTNYRRDSAIKGTLGLRLKNLVQRSFLTKSGTNYSITENGRSYLEGFDTADITYYERIQFWVGAAQWGDRNDPDDQITRFISNNVWETDHNSKSQVGNRIYDRLEKIRNEDKIALRYFSRRTGEIEIRNIGTVLDTENSQNGTIDVLWDIKFESFRLPLPKGENAGNFNDTLIQVKRQDIVDDIFFHDTISEVYEEPESISEGDDEDTIIENLNTNVELQTDNPTDIDQLGRKPLVEALSKYINRLWNHKNKKESYTILLDGEWGSGKSTVLRLLRNVLQNDNMHSKKENQWIVIDFNAWQNQHIEMPWWIFLDSVYKGIKDKSTWFGAFSINIRELFWRLFVINDTKWYTFLVFIFIGIVALVINPEILSFKTENLTGFKNAIALILSLISLIGTIWFFFLGVIRSLLPSNEDAAKNYRQFVRDPMSKLKRHYSSVIGYTKKNVAVFIDDIDRCNPSYVVKLLEGLQTLFRDEKILYVIAGDALWIRKSFEIEYGELREVIEKPGQSLGNFFVEKSLQMSVSVPQLSKEQRKAYWDILIKNRKKGSENSEIAEEAEDEKLAESIREIERANSDRELDRIIENIQDPVNKTILREKAVERLSENDILENIEHELSTYDSLLEPNPRSMKRLVNNYALERQSNILSGKGGIFDKDVFIRMLILRNRFPLIAGTIFRSPNRIKEYKENPQWKEVSEILQGVDEEKVLILSQES